MNGAQKKSTRYKKILAKRFIQKTVEKSFCVALGVRIRDVVMPLSIRLLPTEIKMTIIPINPNSAGINILASIIWATKLISCTLNCCVNVQRRPETVFFRKDIIAFV
jgi:hypothetical protein